MARRHNTDEYEALLYGEGRESSAELRRKRSVLLGLMLLGVFMFVLTVTYYSISLIHSKKHAKTASDEIY